MRTEDYRKKIEDKKTQLSSIRKEINELENEMFALMVKNKEYITDLTEFNGKEITFIALDSNAKEVLLPTDEIVEVVDGRLYLSSYQGGIVCWDSKEGCYVEYYHHSVRKLDIIGFVDVKVIEE